MLDLKVTLVVILCCGIVGSLAKPLLRSGVATIQEDDINYRLPNETAPVHYKVQLMTRIDMSVFAFEGEVQITIEIKETTDQIVVHSRQLNINSIELYEVSIPSRLIAGTIDTYDETTEFLTITSPEALLVTRTYVLIIKYDGFLRSDEAGFYLAQYNDENGRPR